MIVIHIGLKKSGSSSIQTFLAANDEALRSMGIDYCAIGRHRKAHHNLASDAMVRLKFDARHGTLGGLGQAVARSPYPITLISSEMFEGCEDYAVEHVREALEPAGQPIRIVLIIRELIDLITSRYAQKIRYGRNHYDFDTFIESKLGELRVNYFETASRWAQVFGWDNIRVRPLDSSQLLNGDLIDDFLSMAGADMSHPVLATLKRPGVVNAASGWKTLEAIRALHTNRHGLEPFHPLAIHVTHSEAGVGAKQIEAAAQRAGEDLGWSRDKSRYLTRFQAQRTLDIYAEAVDALNSRLTRKLPQPRTLEQRGFVERDFMPDVTHIPPDELRAFYEQLSAQFFRQGEALGDAFSSNLTIEDAGGEKPALLLQPIAGNKGATRLIVEASDFYKRDDEGLVARRFCDEFGLKFVDVQFVPPGLVSGAGPKKAVKLDLLRHWSTPGKPGDATPRLLRDPPDARLKIVSLADGRTLRGLKGEHLQVLSERLGRPISFEPICLPPIPVLLSDAVFLDYFRLRSRDSKLFASVMAIRKKLRDADVIVIDDIAEMQWPMMRSYPVISYRRERSADADLLAFRNETYTRFHDQLPIAVINGADLALEQRDVVINAFSRVIGTPVFRMAAARALTQFTLDWDFRPLATEVGGPGQPAVNSGDFVTALGDWIEGRICEGAIISEAGQPDVEVIRPFDLRPFDCSPADLESLTRVLDAFQRFCITGPEASVAFIPKYLAAHGKAFVRAPAHDPKSLSEAESFDCLLCCGSTGPIETSKPSVAVMSAGWPTPGLNLPEAIGDIPPRGRLPSCEPTDWYSPLPKHGALAGVDQSMILEIAKLTREQRERTIALASAGSGRPRVPAT